MNSSLPARHRTAASAIFRLGAVLAFGTFAACSSVVGGGEVTGGDTTQDAQLSDSAVDIQDTGLSDTAVTDANPADAGICPATPPIGQSGTCTGIPTCEYGQECCCGKCSPSIVCQCGQSGTWACMYTDFCLGASLQCPDATDASPADNGASDAGSADVSTSPWTLFTLSQGGFCAPGTDCFNTWQLSTDGTVHTKKGGTNATKQLTGQDLAAIKATLDQMEFLNKMKDGFTCGQPPTDISYSFSYALFGVKYDQDVTGCQLSGGQDGPLVQGIVALLKAY